MLQTMAAADVDAAPSRAGGGFGASPRGIHLAAPLAQPSAAPSPGRTGATTSPCGRFNWGSLSGQKYIGRSARIGTHQLVLRFPLLPAGDRVVPLLHMGSDEHEANLLKHNAPRGTVDVHRASNDSSHGRRLRRTVVRKVSGMS